MFHGTEKSILDIPVWTDATKEVLALRNQSHEILIVPRNSNCLHWEIRFTQYEISDARWHTMLLSYHDVVITSKLKIPITNCTYLDHRPYLTLPCVARSISAMIIGGSHPPVLFSSFNKALKPLASSLWPKTFSPRYRHCNSEAI